MFKAAIFDLDGTLVDSLELHLRSFMNVCERHGIPVEEQFVIDRFGMTVKEIFTDILSAAGKTGDVDKLSEEKSSEFRSLICQIKALPGALQLLSVLERKGIALALATGNKHEDLYLIAENARLPGFNVYIGAEDVAHGKPAPDVFLTAAEKLSISPAECVVFEDAVLGIRAAKAAGMRAVAVLTGLAKKEELEAESPDLVVLSLADVSFEDVRALFGQPWG